MSRTTSTLSNANDSYTLNGTTAQKATNYSTSAVLSLRTGGAGGTLYSYVYFGLPAGLRGSSVVSATLRFHNTENQSGSRQVTLKKVTSAWYLSKITWNVSPTVSTTDTKIITLSSPVKDTEWAFDVTSHLQAVSDGTLYYGWRLELTSTDLMYFYSSQAKSAYKPVLEIVWSTPPSAPTQLSPSGNRAVSVNKPTLRFDFGDTTGSTSLQAVQVQINSTNVWTSPSFDSGTVSTDAAQLDLTTTAYAGLAANASVYWRVRVQDNIGQWSAWSQAAQFQRLTKGTLTMDNPAVTVTTNHITNPDAVGTTNWSSDHSTLTAVAGAVVGTADGTGNMHVFHTPVIAVTAGSKYVYQLQIKGSANKTAQMEVDWRTGAGAYISTSTLSVGALTTSFAYHEVVLTAPATAAQASVYVTWLSPSNGDVLSVQKVMFELGSTATTYFSGASVSDSANVYAWTGTANASTSTRTWAFISEPTPPIIWTFTGRTQKAYQVYVKLNGAVISDSGKVTGTTNSYTVPSGVITADLTAYLFGIRIWDDQAREVTPNDPAWVEITRTAYYSFDATIDPVSSVSAVDLSPLPGVRIDWSRATAPDSFVLWRDGKIVYATISPMLYNTGSTTYSIVDPNPSPKKSHGYIIQAVVNGKASLSNPVAHATPNPSGIWLSDRSRNIDVRLLGVDEGTWSMREESAAFAPVGGTKSHIVTQALGGYEGTITGQIMSYDDVDVDAEEAKLWLLKSTPGATYILTLSNVAMNVVISNLEITPTPNKETTKNVSFKFYQQDGLLFTPTL